MTFNIDDYVDVAERIRIFREKHPDGSLQSTITLVNENVGDRYLLGVMCQAWAYRSGTDPRPGIGHSFLEIPGKTPYTKDSEVENAETSAWGRAIVAALAADTKKVASADELRTKVSTASEGTSSGGSGAVTAQNPTPAPPAPQTSEWVFPSGKHAGKPLSAVPLDYLSWYQANGPKQDVKDQIALFLGGTFSDPYDSIPFDRTIDGLGN